jgi:hypothetical protein
MHQVKKCHCKFFSLSWYQVACLGAVTNIKIDCGKYKLNDCNPTEDLSFEVIVLCKGRVIFNLLKPSGNFTYHQV